MPQVGIRELKSGASEIIRTVREEGVEYVVTHRGRPVAVISPLDEDEVTRGIALARSNDKFWQRIDTLRDELDANWQSDRSALELLEEQRR